MFSRKVYILIVLYINMVKDIDMEEISSIRARNKTIFALRGVEINRRESSEDIIIRLINYYNDRKNSQGSF